MAYLRHPRSRMRHGRKNTFRDPWSQESDRHSQPLRPLPYGAQSRYDEQARKTTVTEYEKVHQIA